MIIKRNGHGRWLWALLILAACAPPAPAPTATPEPTLEPGDSKRNLMVTGLDREYLIHIPPGLNGSQPVPVVFSFHGSDGHPSFMQTQTGFDMLADANGFVVIYPSGFDGSWNVGFCCGRASEDQVDEAAFVRAILTDLATLVTVDSKRVYAAGLSLGAMLSFRLACEMADTFAAIGSVSGVLVTDPCQPSNPVAVIMVHGVGDQVVRYEGGESATPHGTTVTLPSVPDSLAAWVQLDACTGQPQVEQSDVHGILTITHTSYAECQAGTAVELYALDPFGHDWPNDLVMPVSQIMWSFFAAHPKP